jgi:hypothetical protein
VLKTKKALDAAGGKVTNQRLVDYYTKTIHLSTESEPVSISFIEGCTNIFNHVLKNPVNMGLLQSLAETYGPANPLNSMAKLRAILSKTDKEPTMIPWALEKVKDEVDSGVREPGEVTERNLKEGGGGHKGLVDTYCLKKQLLTHFLTTDIDNRIKGPDSHTRKAKVLDIFKNHASYRQKMNPINQEPEMTFLAEYKDSEKMTIRAYESLVYSTECDPQLRYCARLKRTPAESMEAQGIKELFDAIESQAALESAVANVGAPAAAADGATSTSATTGSSPSSTTAESPSAGPGDDKVSGPTFSRTTSLHPSNCISLHPPILLFHLSTSHGDKGGAGDRKASPMNRRAFGGRYDNHRISVWMAWSAGVLHAEVFGIGLLSHEVSFLVCCLPIL